MSVCVCLEQCLAHRKDLPLLLFGTVTRSIVGLEQEYERSSLCTNGISSLVRKADVNDFTNNYLIAMVSARKEESKMLRQWIRGSLT